MELLEALQTTGLNEKEAAVYTALLQLGRTSAYSVSLKSGLKKPTTYVILEQLIEKGLVQRVPRVKKQLYFANSPETLFGVAEEKLSLAKQKLPELLAMTRGDETKVSTVFYEGFAGMKKLMEYGLKEYESEEMVGFWATDSSLPKSLTDYFKYELAPEHKKHGISMRGIAPRDPLLADYRKMDTEYNRNIRPIPIKEYSSEVAVSVLGNIVKIEDYKNLQGVAIENKDVAKTFKQIFEMVWKRVE
jgi:HTH-type transcriptional regulator, sugar sensing transcriptional regulator